MHARAGIHGRYTRGGFKTRPYWIPDSAGMTNVDACCDHEFAGQSPRLAPRFTICDGFSLAFE